MFNILKTIFVSSLILLFFCVALDLKNLGVLSAMVCFIALISAGLIYESNRLIFMTKTKQRKIIKVWALIQGRELAYADYSLFQIAQHKRDLISEKEEHIYLINSKIIPVEISYSIPITKSKKK